MFIDAMVHRIGATDSEMKVVDRESEHKYQNIYYEYKPTSHQKKCDCQPMASLGTSGTNTHISSTHSNTLESQQLIKPNKKLSLNTAHRLRRPILPRRIGTHVSGFCRTLMNCLMLFLHIVVIAATTLPASATSQGPKYETVYACEGKTLTIECEPGDLINLIRANYGRFSITICNDHGNVDWSVNCMSAKSLRVLHSKCALKQNCSVLASTNMFGDPCTGTHKYLEAHYQCVSAAQSSTTTSRPSPPWLVTSQPSVWGTSTIRNPTTARIADFGPISIGNNNNTSNNDSKNGSETNKTITSSIPNISNRKSVTKLKTTGNKNTVSTSTSSTTLAVFSTVSPLTTQLNEPAGGLNGIGDGTLRRKNESASVAAITTAKAGDMATSAASAQSPLSTTTIINNSTNDQHRTSSTSDTVQKFKDYGDGFSPQGNKVFSTQSAASSLNTSPNGGTVDDAKSNYFCGPTRARDLFWNFTRVGEVNVIPCPGGASGIAKWRCVYAIGSINQQSYGNGVAIGNEVESTGLNEPYMDSNSNMFVTWQPLTPDLTQCRSLWLSNLELRVNQRDSALISIANDLSQVTSSKTLFGGDMLVTTKIIQTMSEKMTYDIDTFTDQRQREAVVYELLHGVVKTGSNLLDETQHLSWQDLSFEDQMRVATSLLTGLEDNAFLLADTITRERNVVQKVKNILLSVRVLETRNIAGNEIFPDASAGDEQWEASEDSIELPKGALIENSESGLVRIVFVAFDRLESILRPMDTTQIDPRQNVEQSSSDSATASNPSEPEQNQRIRVLNSKVISASLGKGRHIQLSQPIKLILKHLMVDNVTNPACVFWNYIDHAWSEDGCYIEQTNRTHTVCMCNHLTNFAILMDLVDDGAETLQQLSFFNENMKLMISISVAVCIIFIIIALITLKLFNGIFVKSNRTTIYKNLYICLLVIELLFWLGIIQNESSMLCGFTTAFLHCAFLCAVSWIFLEGFQLYITLTTEEILLEVEKSTRILFYYLLAYGLSFTIVAISLGIDPSSYTIHGNACIWMEQNSLFYVTFIMPCCVYILANVCYSTYSTYVLCKKYKSSIKNKEHARLANVRGFVENCVQPKILYHQFFLRCSLVFLLIFIACWICAYLYMSTKRDLREAIGSQNRDSLTIEYQLTKIKVFGYAFVILNIIQGMYILGFHCIQNEKIRRDYRKFVRQQSWLPKCLRCTKSGTTPGQSGTGQNPSGPVAIGSPHNIGSLASESSPPSNNHHSGTLANSGNQTLNMGGTLSRHQGNRHNILVERAFSSGTLRGTPSTKSIVGQSSPTSSACSTHLIYNTGTQKKHQYDLQRQEMGYSPDLQTQQFHQIHSSQQSPMHQSDAKNFLHYNMMDEANQQNNKFSYYDRKAGSKTLKSLQSPHSPGQHDYFYFTGTGANTATSGKQKHRKHSEEGFSTLNKQYSTGKDDQQMPIMSTHKKKAMQYAQSGGRQSPTINNSNGHGSYNPATGNRKQPASFNSRIDGQELNHRQSRLGYYNQHSQQHGVPGGHIMAAGGNFSNYGPDEPVYEEIMSNRVSDTEDFSDEISHRNGRFPDTMPIRPLLKNNGYDYSQQQNSPQSQQSFYHQQPPQQIGRNISAMLDENNTVVCYLEPITKS